MFEMRLDHVVEQIVQTELLGKGRVKEALYVNFDIRVSSYTDDLDITRLAGLHLLYQCHPLSQTVSVWSGITDSPFDKIHAVKEWKHEVTHDSCWRTINATNELYFRLSAEVNAERVLANKRELPPRDLSHYASFGFNKHLFLWVPIETSYDPADKYKYRRLVKILK